MAFRGNFDYQLDDRNRVALPPKFREAFANGAVLTPGMDGCIEVYTPEGYDREAEIVNRVPAHSELGRKLRRAFFGSAFDVQRDGQGRLLIPARLLSYAGIEKDVMVVGADQRLEIWDRQRWENQEEDLQVARAEAMEQVDAQDALFGGMG